MISFKKYLVVAVGLILLAIQYCFAQPAGYYLSAEGKTGTQLQQALHDIIDNQTPLTYTALWTAFQVTDKKSTGKVWDMYSDKPGTTPAYTYTFVTDQCGNYSAEGDCYNREHSFPKSWFNDLEPMYTDLFHLYPTDGYVNGKRSNYPFGTTNSPSWTSTNGSRLGPSSYPGYSGIVFEPINEYKGDFARTMFYMAVRYYGEDSGWAGSDMVTGSQLKDWALKMCLEWHKNDPVSSKETARNEAVYGQQGNRNPFIDNPSYADLIWGTQSSTGVTTDYIVRVNVFPNPATDNVRVVLPSGSNGIVEIFITDISGKLLYHQKSTSNDISMDVSFLDPGLYIIKAESANKLYRVRLVVSR
ncbi:MAG: endonuclease [Bacteroidales bacterium]